MAATKAAKSATKKVSRAFSDAEKSAMRQRIKEVQAGDADDDGAVRAKIAEMAPSDRALAERLHAVLKANAPTLSPKLWYGMPAYAKKGKVVCHFQDARKFKTRYATLGFSDEAKLDEGEMWPVAYALKKLTRTEEAKVVALVKRAMS